MSAAARLDAELGAVTQSLLGSAGSRSSAAICEAQDDAVETADRAEAASRAVLEEARAAGCRMAEETAARRLRAARRQAREVVLAARRESVLQIREEAARLLAEYLDSPAGDPAYQSLIGWVRNRSGGFDVHLQSDDAGSRLVAELAGCRAELNLEDLVKVAMGSLADELEHL